MMPSPRSQNLSIELTDNSRVATLEPPEEFSIRGAGTDASGVIKSRNPEAIGV
jgi:hypothetical protein